MAYLYPHPYGTASSLMLLLLWLLLLFVLFEVIHLIIFPQNPHSSKVKTTVADPSLSHTHISTYAEAKVLLNYTKKDMKNN